LALKFSRKERTYIPEWANNKELDEKEQISVNFTPLTVEDMFKVQRETKADLFGGMDLSEEDPESFQKYWAVLRCILVEYTASWKNIIVDDVELTSPSEVLSALGTGEMELLNEVFKKIIEASSGTKEEEKNSDAGSGATSSDSATTAEVVSPPTSEEKETVSESS
jgi:hypothetical protein